jgi:hypothetical protein
MGGCTSKEGEKKMEKINFWSLIEIYDDRMDDFRDK